MDGLEGLIQSCGAAVERTLDWFEEHKRMVMNAPFYRVIGAFEAPAQPEDASAAPDASSEDAPSSPSSGSEATPQTGDGAPGEQPKDPQ